MNKIFEKLKEFKTRVENRIKEKWLAFNDWVRNNQETAVIVIPAVGAFLFKIVKFIFADLKKDRQLSEERELKENYCYDRSLGHYWHLKRDLSNKEWREIESRRDQGESLGEILESLRVLK